MSLFVGYIFSDMFKPLARHKTPYNLPYYPKRGFDWESIKLAMIVTAPAIILHEFGHKFMAMLFGFNATFNAAYMWLFLGLLLKFFGAGFIFFVPAYVSIYGTGTHLQYALVAFAGPLVNLLLFFVSDYAIKNNLTKRSHLPLWIISKKINLFLFAFNLIPFPGFDGFQALWHLYHAFL